MDNPILEVVWSPEAERSFYEILLYLTEEWSVASAKKFDAKVEKLIGLLQTQYKLCPASKQKYLRKCLVIKQTSMIYRVMGNRLEIILFIDNRSHHSF